MLSMPPLKILVLGDGETGKTSVIRRLVHDSFRSQHVASKPGVEFHLCEVLYDGKVVHLQLWDVNGAVPKVYFKDMFGALLIYDVTRPSTFDTVLKWKKLLDDHEKVPVVLLGNKQDMESAQADEEALESFRESNGFAAHLDTSAKTGRNVREAALKLVANIAQHRDAFSKKHNDHILFRPNDAITQQGDDPCCY